MLKERIQEVFDFTKSESPYRKANKGWINKDIFLDLNPSADTYKQKNEAAKVTLFWSPINSLLSNVFLTIILCSIIVYTSVSFAKGRLNLNLFNNFGINEIVNIDKTKDINIISHEEIESTNLLIQQNLDEIDLDKSIKSNSLDDDLNKADEIIINEKIDKQDSSKIESESNKDIKILENKKVKSNII